MAAATGKSAQAAVEHLGDCVRRKGVFPALIFQAKFVAVRATDLIGAEHASLLAGQFVVGSVRRWLSLFLFVWEAFASAVASGRAREQLRVTLRASEQSPPSPSNRTARSFFWAA